MLRDAACENSSAPPADGTLDTHDSRGPLWSGSLDPDVQDDFYTGLARVMVFQAYYESGVQGLINMRYGEE